MDRRTLIGTLATLAAAPACSAFADASDSLTPEMFGARGDGVTNDTAAFRRLSAAIARRGGGAIELRAVTYLVGEQARGVDGMAFGPAPILSFDGLAGPLAINGNGATLRCAPGLRYGSFDPATGAPHRHSLPFLERPTRATPYQFMIQIERCAGSVTVRNIELDGNLPALRIGGSYGDTGIQIAASGLYLHDNSGDELLADIHTHHHGQDGLMISGLSTPRPGTRRVAERLRCENNARQGCSLIGGRGWRFVGCAFNRTGRSTTASAPAAGFDMEAEGGKTNRDHSFVDCVFDDNVGAGFVADSGDSADATFLRCRFVGTTATSLWPNKPGLVFTDCRIVGTMVGCYGSPDASRAARFVGCTFTDAAAQSVRGLVYRQGRANGPLADLGTAPNITFDRCRFLAVGGAVLPWSTGAIYRDCTMRQTVPAQGYPRGRYEGRTTISGNVDLNGSTIGGAVTVNGQVVPRS